MATTAPGLFRCEIVEDGIVKAIDIAMTKADIEKVQAVRDAEKPGRYETGTFVEVTDQLSGEQFEIASAPCGLGCHCACAARRPQ